MKKFFAILIIANLFVNPQLVWSADKVVSKNAVAKAPKNLIFLIADGAGLSHISLNIIEQKDSNYKRFSNVGLITTHSANAAITDSAAAATAFATGQKTNNGMIAMDNKGRPLITIFEIAKKKKLSTAIIVTSSVTHATPAAFVAKVKSRSSDDEIANYFAKNGPDIFIGGGLRYFNSSNGNLLEKLQKNGYKIYKDGESLFADDYQGKIAAMIANDQLKTIKEGRGDYSVFALKKALDVLSKNKNGFILMVEGSQIDWASHDNDIQYLRDEMADFDKILAVALDFAKQDKNTLVIAASDHETGGLSLVGENNENDKKDYGNIAPKFASNGHSAVLVPVFAYGPQAETFNGIYDNTEIFNKIIAALNIKQ